MTIGEKIKHLRQKNNITQEKLAEYLNISYQSVSKWENNNALPDISFVVPIANFFGVSIDELFDRDKDHREDDVNEYLAKDQALANKGLIDERIPLWRSAVQKYPRNYKCLQMLALALWKSKSSDVLSDEEIIQNGKESVEINERILADCTDDAIRDQVLQILVFSYGDKWYPFADEEKAVAYAKKAPSLYVSNNLLLEHAYYTDEGLEKAKRQKHNNILTFIDCATIRLVNQKWRTHEECIKAYESAIKIWDTVIYDGNYLFYHCRLELYYRLLAKSYAAIKNREKTLECLELAKYHATKTDSQPAGEQYYTSMFVSCAYSDALKTRKNYTETHIELFKNDLSLECFDFIRNDPEFVKLQTE